MSMSAPIPRFLPPRGYMLQYTQRPRLAKIPQLGYRTLPVCRNASTRTPKPRVLEKPTRFNPPSHGKRLKQQIPRQYGPQLTVEQKAEQGTKKYPNLMPAPGTWMYWFLTSRGIHTFITLGTLVLLASITAFERWRLATEFREQLPAAADIFFQPFTAFWQAFEVYRLETAKTTAEVVRMRDKNVEDIQKRNTYRIAHGLQDENEQGLGGWKKASGVVGLGPGAAADEAVRRPVGVEPGQEMEVKGVMRSGDIPEGPVRDPEDRRKPVKKWLGIW